MSQEEGTFNKGTEGREGGSKNQGGGGEEFSKGPGRNDPAYHEQRKREEGGGAEGGMKDFDRGGEKSRE